MAFLRKEKHSSEESTRKPSVLQVTVGLVLLLALVGSTISALFSL